jgi:hypothetical protein
MRSFKAVKKEIKICFAQISPARFIHGFSFHFSCIGTIITPEHLMSQLSELARRRIAKEYDLFRTNGPDHGFFLESSINTTTNSSTEWRVLLLAPDSSIYQDEQYTLIVSFPSTYRTYLLCRLFAFWVHFCDLTNFHIPSHGPTDHQISS